MTPTPQHDDTGLHILDPNDKMGFKSKYISLIHKKAIDSIIPDSSNSSHLAVDIGCGYGRITNILANKGYSAVGIDPSLHLIEFAKLNNKKAQFIQGALPNLPVKKDDAKILVMHNLLRVLKITNNLHLINGIGEYLSKDGLIYVVDNIKNNDPNFFNDFELIQLFEREGLKLEKRIPLRSSKNIMLCLIRYGVLPEKMHNTLANYELKKMQLRKKPHLWEYWNVAYTFSKVDK